SFDLPPKIAHDTAPTRTAAATRPAGQSRAIRSPSDLREGLAGMTTGVDSFGVDLATGRSGFVAGGAGWDCARSWLFTWPLDSGIGVAVRTASTWTNSACHALHAWHAARCPATASGTSAGSARARSRLRAEVQFMMTTARSVRWGAGLVPT